MAQEAKEIALDEEIRDDNRIITGWLLYYEERKKAYLRRREEILESSPPCLNDILPGRGNCVADPTGRKGDKLAELAETERWLEFVEELERRLPWRMLLFLKLRREAKYSKKGGRWEAYVMDRYADHMANLLKKKKMDACVISEAAVRQWWNRILEYAGRLAGKRGLL